MSLKQLGTRLTVLLLFTVTALQEAGRVWTGELGLAVTAGQLRVS
jgi:hypothetical protein